jgi:hypothetical protein
LGEGPKGPRGIPQVLPVIFLVTAATMADECTGHWKLPETRAVVKVQVPANGHSGEI